MIQKECKDCWHNYHCPIPQEGYDYNPDTCPYNPDNDKKEFGRLKKILYLCNRNQIDYDKDTI